MHEEHVGADPVFEVVVDGAEVEVVDLDGAEVAFDAGEVLVGGDHTGVRPGCRRGRWCG